MIRVPKLWHQWHGQGTRDGMTKDEALAAALAESAPGDLVLVHAEGCRIGALGRPPTTEELDSCGCEPLELQIGAFA